MNALITGATRGTGKSIAAKFASQGFDIVALAQSEERLSALKLELEDQYGISVNCFPINFNDVTNTEISIKKLSQNLKNIDVLVNNAGVFDMDTVEELSLERLDFFLNINLKAAFLLSKHLVPLMKKAGKGHIFNVGSIVTKLPRFEVSGYSISKYALHGLTKVLTEQLKDHNIKVTEIIPGSINSSSWDGIDAPKEDFIQTNDISETIWQAYNLTPGANMEEIVIRPLNKNF